MPIDAPMMQAALDLLRETQKQARLWGQVCTDTLVWSNLYSYQLTEMLERSQNSSRNQD